MNAGVKSARPGYSFLVCPDSELLLRHLAELLERHKPASGQWERLVFWGDEPPNQRYWDSLCQHGLFQTNRAVVVRRANEWAAADWKNISAALAEGFGAVWPIFCLEVDWEKGKFKIPAHIQKTKCLIFAEKQKWVWSQKSLAGADLKHFVEALCGDEGIKMDRDAMNLFCEMVRPDAAAIKNELRKLVLACPDGKINAGMLSLDSSMPEQDAFLCVKKILSGDVSGVWQEISRSSDSGILFFLIALLARELRTLWQIQSGENVRLHPADAALKRGLATKLSRAGVAAGFSALVDAEWQVKSGRQNPAQALESLVTSLCALFRGKNS